MFKPSTKAGPIMHFVLYADTSGQWRWRLVAANSKTIADSGESYTTKASAQEGINLVKTGAADAPIKDK